MNELSKKPIDDNHLSALMACIIGLLILVPSFFLLFFNEKLSTETERMIKFTKSNITSVSADEIKPENEGKLIHISGMAKSLEQLSDDLLNMEMNIINLTRKAYTYQWREMENSRKSVMRNRYRYDKIWSLNQINSSRFVMSGHNNPEKTINSYSKYIRSMNVGSYEIYQTIIGSFLEKEELNIDYKNHIPNGYKHDHNGDSNYYYNSKDSSNPKIGDIRVEYEYIPLQFVTIIGRQVGTKVFPLETEYGKISCIRRGKYSAKEIIDHSFKVNLLRIWLFRIAGFLMLFIGLKMCYKCVELTFLNKKFHITTSNIFIVSLTIFLIIFVGMWIFYSSTTIPS